MIVASEPELVGRAQTLIRSADDAGLIVRAVGGVAFHLQCRDRSLIAGREFGDLDFVVPAGLGAATSRFIAEQGYEPAKHFNALRGDRRLLFGAGGVGVKLDVFVGAFQMCHTIPVADRLSLDDWTIPRPELLMTKLQVVELNAKDIVDMHSLLLSYDVTSGDPSGIDATVIAGMCAGDWGLWRTTTLNLERLVSRALTADLRPRETETVAARVRQLDGAIAAAPKSTRWKMRARVGDRVRWYNEPEEV
jgi:hypothetical protein